MKWTEKEIVLLKHLYETSVYPAQICTSLNRTQKSIEHKIKSLGLSRSRCNTWTKQEIDLIKKNLNKSTKYLCELFPNRTKCAITARAFILGKKTRDQDGFCIKKGTWHRFDKDRNKYIAEYTDKIESSIGRQLNKGECVHHIDGNHFNNKIENLFLCKDVSQHLRAHHSLLVLLSGLMKLGAIYFDKEAAIYKISSKIDLTSNK